MTVEPSTIDAVLRVGAIRWAVARSMPQTGSLLLSAAPGEPGQTCVALAETHPDATAPLVASVYLRDRVDGLGADDSHRAGAGARRAAARELARTLGCFMRRPEPGRSTCSRLERTIPKKATWSLPALRQVRGAFS